MCSSDLGVEQLFDTAGFDESGFGDGRPDLVAGLFVVRTVGAAVVVELNLKAGEVPHMGFAHIGNHGFFGPTFATCANHNGRSMRVVSADEDAAMTAQFLKADPDIGLDVFHQMPDMDVSIGIGQGSGDENLSGHASDQQT